MRSIGVAEGGGDLSSPSISSTTFPVFLPLQEIPCLFIISTWKHRKRLRKMSDDLWIAYLKWRSRSISADFRRVLICFFSILVLPPFASESWMVPFCHWLWPCAERSPLLRLSCFCLEAILEIQEWSSSNWREVRRVPTWLMTMCTNALTNNPGKKMQVMF